jgi:imidazoleglycerol phosphate synthase glutamine amidotransferase subunit HisH
MSAPRIAVLDYGAANMVSVTQALAMCGPKTVSEPEALPG